MTGGPERRLVLDRDPQDPRWLLVAVALPLTSAPPSWTRPAATPTGRRSSGGCGSQFHCPVELVPVHDALT